MSVFKRGNIWWYRFQWDGVEVRESSGVSNRRTAEKMESAHKNRLALGEVGIREKVKIPTLREFAEKDFRPFIRQHCADKPRTLTYYEGGLTSLLAVPALANAPMDTIRQEQITAFVSGLREKGFEVSSMNRKLDPFPGPSDSAHIFPPCTSTICFASARPSPVPSMSGCSF